MTTGAIIHHEAEPSWLSLSKSVGAISDLHHAFLDCFRSNGVWPDLMSLARFDTSANAWNYEAYLGTARMLFNNGKLKIFHEGHPNDGTLGAILEQTEVAFNEIEKTIRTLVSSRKIRLHGRREKLQNPFENIPIDFLDAPEFRIDVLNNCATFPDGERYLSVHLEALDGAVRVELPPQETPDRPQVGKKAVEKLVQAMITEAPELLTKTRAAELLNTTQRARQFSRIWSDAVADFARKNVATTRPYGSPGRPPKNDAAEKRRGK